ncbi:hypothetical protein B0H14DRAFT_2718183 [Mycena olivaceomarginata]|nr:hypothetical protein B0H14DRAFT_2718183 [Mycena olivaceomarginata]
MPDIRRVDSDTTHISDSEPERETARLRARKPRTGRTSRTSIAPSRRQMYSRVPLSDRTNDPEYPQPTEVEPNFGVEARLIRLETRIAQIQATLNERSMADKCVGEALPLDAADASSSLDDAGTVELGIGLARLREELEEFEELVERTEARKCLLECTTSSCVDL